MHEYKVLDHGFIKLVDHMGSDSTIANTARTSYGKGTKSISDDRTLLRYMMRHFHTSPFEFAEIILHVKLPIFVARQWIRHRTASVSEISGRYSELRTEFYNPSELRKQSQSNKQGSSSDTLEYNIGSYDKSATEYQSLLNKDVAREQARIVLPLSTYTEWIWKIDLHNLMHFLSLRLDSHAQEEIRKYAQYIAKIVEDLFPITWEAFVDYKLEAVTLSKSDIHLLRIAFNKDWEPLKKEDWKHLELSKREYKEFQQKLRRILK